MKTTQWASWLLRRAVVRIAAVVAALLVASYAVPKVVLYEARAKARDAGYEMTADRAELRPWEVVLHEVRATGARADLTAESLTVKVNTRLRSTGMTARKAEVNIRESKGGEAGGRRTEVSLIDSNVHIRRGKTRADAYVRTARVGTDGRVWADADVRAEYGGVSVSAMEVEASGVRPDEPMNLSAKSVDVVVTDVPDDVEGSSGGQAVKRRNLRVTADRMTVTREEERVTADKVKAEVDTDELGQKLHLEAERMTAAGNSAEWVSADLNRKREDHDRVEVSFSADSVETENRKMSSAEFSVKKIRADATVIRNGRYFTVPVADVHVGSARVSMAASTWSDGVHVEAEMPEIGCQELLQSLPRGLVPKLRPEGGDTRMSGTISWKVQVDVDMPARKKPDVSIWLRNKCVVESVPDELNVQRLTRPFKHDEYTADGKRTSETVGPGSKNWVPLSVISPMMPAAVMAMEDPSFMSHRGILIQAIENSMEQNITAGKFVRGGSTISMQLAKNLWLAREKTISRKIQEAVLTTYLEQKMTKTQMIELYLNVVEFGPNLYGIGPASRHYFAKDPGSLTLSQSLFLASLLPSPRSAGFEEGKKVSQGRLDLLRKVMKMMLDRGTIGPSQYEQGLKETPVFGDPSAMGEAETEPKAPGGIDPSEWR
jgi:hypothetical protein